MNGDPKRTRVLAAQGLAALAYFFCVHGAHAATSALNVHAGGAHAHAAAVSTQPRRP
jgi:hypothetical protein